MSAGPRRMSRWGWLGLGHGTCHDRVACRPMRSATPRRARSGASASTRRESARARGGWAFISCRRARASGRPTSSTTGRAAPSRWPGRRISTGTRCSTGADLLHLSGITPALGPRSAEAAKAAAAAAKAKGVAISFDGNYRAQLWGRWDSDPAAILRELVGQADILFGNHRDISLLLGREFSGDGPERRREAAEAAFAAFPGLKLIASTARHVTDADTHRISARLDGRDGWEQTEEKVVAGIVDRIGAGRRLRRGHPARHAERSGPRPHRPCRARAHLPQAQPAGRCEPVRPARHRRLPGRGAGRPALAPPPCDGPAGARTARAGRRRRCGGSWFRRATDRPSGADRPGKGCCRAVRSRARRSRCPPGGGRGRGRTGGCGRCRPPGSRSGWSARPRRPG